MNELYQDANNCSPFDIKFSGGVIKVSTDDTVIPAGWEVTINQQYQQVSILINATASTCDTKNSDASMDYTLIHCRHGVIVIVKVNEKDF